MANKWRLMALLVLVFENVYHPHHHRHQRRRRGCHCFDECDKSRFGLVNSISWNALKNYIFLFIQPSIQVEILFFLRFARGRNLTLRNLYWISIIKLIDANKKIETFWNLFITYRLTICDEKGIWFCAVESTKKKKYGFEVTGKISFIYFAAAAAPFSFTKNRAAH